MNRGVAITDQYLSNVISEPRLAVVDWDYNAWGGKYPPFDLDEVVPTRIAEHFRLPVFYPEARHGRRLY